MGTTSDMNLVYVVQGSVFCNTLFQIADVLFLK